MARPTTTPGPGRDALHDAEDPQVVHRMRGRAAEGADREHDQRRPAPRCGARRRPTARRATATCRRRPACRRSGSAAPRAAWRAGRLDAAGRPAGRRRPRTAPASTAPPAATARPPAVSIVTLCGAGSGTGMTGSFGRLSGSGSGSIAYSGCGFGRLRLGRFAAVEAGHHVEAEQAAFEGAVEERRLARFLQAQQLRQADRSAVNRNTVQPAKRCFSVVPTALRRSRPPSRPAAMVRVAAHADPLAVRRVGQQDARLARWAAAPAAPRSA